MVNEGAIMLLYCPAKKVTKERGQRGAEAGCSRTRAAPFGIPRRALDIFRRNLTGKICYLVAALSAAASAALPISFNLALRTKIGTFFVRTGFRLRCSGAIVSARRKDS